MRDVLLILGLTLLAWIYPIFAGGFAFDDFEAIHSNPVVTGALPAAEAWQRDYWHHLGDAGHYRPTATLLLWADHILYGHDGRGYHLTNVLLHAAVALALRALLVALGLGRKEALCAALIVALHPSLADSVAWISGRTSGVSVLAGLLSLSCFASAPQNESRGRVLARASVGALFLFLALAGKEDALLFALLLPAIAASRSRRHFVSAAVATVGATLLYAYLRHGALGSTLPAAPHAPLAGHSLFERLTFGGRAFLEAVRLTIVPLAHSPSYRHIAGFHGASPPTAAFFLGFLAWVALAAGSLFLAWRSQTVSRVRYLGLFAAALAWFPFTGIVPAGEIFAPRFLFLPLVAAAPLFAVPLARLPAKALLCLLPLVLFGTWQRSRTYTGLVPWARAVLEQAPADVTAWNTLALGLEEEGRVPDARQAFERATEIDPEYGRAWSNLGRLALADGDRAGARVAMEQAARVGPANAIAHTNLASLLLRDGDFEGALGSYRRALQLSPGLQPAWRGLGRALRGLDREEEAERAFERALQLDPHDTRTQRLLRRSGE